MIEFFQNIYAWFAENQDNVLTFVTSSNFLALLGLIFSIYLKARGIKKNTLSLNSVSNALGVQNVIAEDVDLIKSGSSKVATSVASMEQRVLEVDRRVTELGEDVNGKLDSLLEVFTIVYSTIKDDTIRNSVNSILVNAKYAKAQAKAQLEEEIEKLRMELANSVKLVSEQADNAMSKVSEVLTGKSENATETVQDNDVRTRY